jgi:hypothetical protein
MDRAVELEREHSTIGHGYISSDPPRDTKLSADWREFEQVGKDLEGRRNEQRQAYRNADNALELLEKQKRGELEREVPGREGVQQLSELQIARVDEINRKYAPLEQDPKRNASREEMRTKRMYFDNFRLPTTCGHGVW